MHHTETAYRHPVVTNNGAVTHVLVPVDEYEALIAGTEKTGWTRIPAAVAEMALDVSPLRAWREYKRMTQQQMAERMGISRPAYTQMEQSEKPHRATLEKAAEIFGIDVAQLVELYDDEPVSTPDGPVNI